MVTKPLSRDAQRQRSLEDACWCAKVAEEFRGRDTIVLDLTEVTPIVDYFVITTGVNPRQMRALAEEVRVQMKARGNRSLGAEGDGDNSWILIDFGDIVLHVFQHEARALYDLERLWADAKHVDWRQQLGLPAPGAATRSPTVADDA